VKQWTAVTYFIFLPEVVNQWACSFGVNGRKFAKIVSKVVGVAVFSESLKRASE